jgi:hypothetical protein
MTQQAMEIYADTQGPAFFTITSEDVSLAAATADVQIGETWYPLTWVGAATTDGALSVREGSVEVRGANGTTGVIISASRVPLLRVHAEGKTIVDESSTRFTVH